MGQHASVLSLLIVVTMAFLTPIILHRLKLNFIPVVVAEIIMGLIIRKSGFNVVHQDMWLSTLSTLGFIFLMFLSGLEIDFTVFSKGKKREILPNGKKSQILLLSQRLFSSGFSFFFSLIICFCHAGLYS